MKAEPDSKVLYGLKNDYFDRLWMVYKRLEQRILKYMMHVFEASLSTTVESKRRATANFELKVRSIKQEQEDVLFSMLDLYRE